MRYKVVGPPGTGKTRKLLNQVEKYLKKGVPLNRIGYFAFTRRAAEEARNRFLKQKPNLEKKDIEYFRTLHSLAFNNLGLKEENVMNELNYKAIGETCGIQINYASYETNTFNGIFSSDSEYLNLINLARVKRISSLEQLDLNEHLSKVERNKLEPYQTFKWKYDDKGNWIKTSLFTNNELVSVTRLKYDKFNNRASHKSYDGDGNLVSRWEYKDRDKMDNWTSRIRYDKNNNAEYLQEYKLEYYD